MNLYLRLIAQLRRYWRLLAATVLATVLFALLEGVSIGMISPLTHALFKEATVAGAAADRTRGDGAMPADADASPVDLLVLAPRGQASRRREAPVAAVAVRRRAGRSPG